MSDGARRVIRGMPRWAEALRSEIKKQQDLLPKLEEQQHNKDSRRKANVQQFIFEFGIKGVRRVLDKHNKATTMREVYWECPIGFRWACIKTPPLVDRMKAQDVLPSLQEQMIKRQNTPLNYCNKAGVPVHTPSGRTQEVHRELLSRDTQQKQAALRHSSHSRTGDRGRTPSNHT